eukprot:TRINITY_DN7212_c0_g1_i1.p1 TRINITY_DN7212_c0_g1~~TRINITY_DN7212_c0_g1_i1.p1  ORF type:complete len:692 (-),score=95.13 TRINITY_DN7212_c0_g1_i1:63-2138(-)
MASALIAVLAEKATEVAPHHLPYSLDRVDLAPEDHLHDLSDEELPTPGKYVGGKRGKAFKTKYGDGSSKRHVKMRRTIGSRGVPVTPPSRPSMVGRLRQLKDAIEVEDTHAPQAAQDIPEIVFASAMHPGVDAPLLELGYTQCNVVLSRFGLPPTFAFQYQWECPEVSTLQCSLAFPVRYATTQLVVRRMNSNTGLFFRVGPGAVAFRVVLSTFQNGGLTHTHNSARANILWTKRVTPGEWGSATEYQRINHFPGTWSVGRKDNLSRTFSRMRQKFGDDDFGFVPHTYLIPQDRARLEADFDPSQTYIVKPAASSCGRGIHLIRGNLPASLTADTHEMREKERQGKAAQVVQMYIGNPLLVDGYKFDLRIYCLVTGFEPLRVYRFNEGLVRFCTEKYDGAASKLSNAFAHLTNYSINKQSSKFVAPGSAAAKARNEEEEEEGRLNPDQMLDTGSKWTLTALRQYLLNRDVDWNAIQSQIDDVLIKTFVSIDSEVKEQMRLMGANNRSCFELFGFDLMLDSNYKIWLIEVNIMPSLSCSTPLDKAVKYSLISNVLTVVGATPYHRGRRGDSQAEPYSCSCMSDGPSQWDGPAKGVTPQQFVDALSPEHALMLMETEDELSRRGNFVRLYPTTKSRKYNRFFDGPRPHNSMIIQWEELKAREEGLPEEPGQKERKVKTPKSSRGSRRGSSKSS